MHADKQLNRNCSCQKRPCRVEQMNLTRKDLEPMIGSRARVAEVINRRCSLSLPMIRKLHKALRIPLESLIAETRAQG